MRERPGVCVEDRLVAALVEEPVVVPDDEGEDDERDPLRDDERRQHDPRLEALERPEADAAG